MRIHMSLQVFCLVVLSLFFPSLLPLLVVIICWWFAKAAAGHRQQVQARPLTREQCELRYRVAQYREVERINRLIARSSR